MPSHSHSHSWLNDSVLYVQDSQHTAMDAGHRGGAGGAGQGSTPPGKGDSNQQQQPMQQLIDIFGTDLYPAAMMLILLVLGLMSASMTRCVC